MAAASGEGEVRGTGRAFGESQGSQGDGMSQMSEVINQLTH